MKNYLLGAAALLAIAAPGVAAADTSGYVGVGYTALDDDDDDNKDHYTTFEGAVVTPLGGDWNLQFDARYNSMDHDSHNDDFAALNAHAFMRNHSWALGGFAGQNLRGDQGFWNLGVEGQLYLSNITLGAAYSYSSETNDDPEDTVSQIDLDGQFFLSPNTAIGADLTWYDDEWESEDGLIYGIGIEHQFAGSPISLGANYRRQDGDYEYGGSHSTDMFGVFARFNFGTSDLQTRSTQGASMLGGASFGRENISTW